MRTSNDPSTEITGRSSPTYSGSVKKGNHRGAELRHSLWIISQRLDQLKRAMSLPYVENDGSSECPDAETLYAEKEQLEAQVTADVEVLKGHRVELKKEIQRSEKNLQQLEADQGKLNRLEPSQCYAEAIKAQQQQLRRLIQDRDAVYIVLAEAEAVLKVSRTRKFPGRVPQKKFGFPSTTPSSSQSPSSQSPTGGLGNELNELLSLGPLEQSQDR